MAEFFTSITQVRSFVKLNANLPFESFKPYIDSACDMYLCRFLSKSFIDSHMANEQFEHLVLRALAPLAVYLSTDEMSISIGDGGITVQNDKEKRSPASDRKIAAAKRNLLNRGCMALSDLIRYVLELQPSEYQDCAGLKALSGLLVSRIEQFEEYVSLDGNYVSFLDLTPLLRSVQLQLSRIVGETLVSSALTGTGEPFVTLAARLRRYIVFRVAELHTGKTTREQRAGSPDTEWQAVIRPLFNDAVSDSWYGEMAAAELAGITEFINKNGEALGLQTSSAEPYDYRHSRIFPL